MFSQAFFTRNQGIHWSSPWNSSSSPDFIKVWWGLINGVVSSMKPTIILSNTYWFHCLLFYNFWLSIGFSLILVGLLLIVFLKIYLILVCPYIIELHDFKVIEHCSCIKRFSSEFLWFQRRFSKGFQWWLFINGIFMI